MFFFAVFFTLYGLLHLYFYIKAARAFKCNPLFKGLLALWLAVMTAAPIFIRLLEKGGYELPARVLSYAGYIWMGFIFLFVSAGLLVDLFCLVKKFITHSAEGKRCRAAYNFFIPAAIACIVSIYGYFDALDIRIERIEIASDKIPASAGVFKVAQISDVHLGLIVREQRLSKIITILEAENPDIIVSTGDLVDGQMYSMNHLSHMLKSLKPVYGKFAVTGNHEYYAGIKQAVAFTEDSGFKMLRNQSSDISSFLSVAGVEDPVSGIARDALINSEKELLHSLPSERFRILLKHRPLVNESSDGLFDLQLSGHTHNGQMFPFTCLTKLYYAKDSGLVKTKNYTLYINRGAGTWGPPIRFLAPPEITVFEISGRSE
ncbi:MAG: metallophosphoesterase [Dissulfurispiraceae bacterium]|jgi:predicted MPP superfamily phosphohydrolase|nr:metallophosphoesterase [Dissulfurispiraceae bacterium]